MRSGIGKSAVPALLLIASSAFAQPQPNADPVFFFRFEIGPALYRYEESGEREFAGLETEWEEFAVRMAQEARVRTPIDLVGVFRFSFLTSGKDTETNNVGSPPTNLRIAYLFEVQPGVQYEARLRPWLTLAPELSWDLDWYLQVRETTSSGDVNESVFWQGPAPGIEAAADLTNDLRLVLGYRHSFLIDVQASNSFAEELGFDEFSTDGDRDVVALRLERLLIGRWRGSIAYRFESTRIDASDTKTRTGGPAGVQTVEVQFPGNEHLVHAALIAVGTTF